MNPSKQTVQKKGKELEQIVRRIEELILSSDPTLQIEELIFESNKWITINGVRHEIDLYVHAPSPKGYDQTFIFECKNWKKAVGKNEVIHFSEKIKATSAQRGFLVAPKFSKDAEAQAKQDPRIKLVKVSQTFSSKLDGLTLLSSSHELTHIEIKIKERGEAIKENPEILNLNDTNCTYDGKVRPFKDYVIELADQWALEDRSSNRPRYLLKGSHKREANYQVAFDMKNEFILNGKDIEYLVINAHYTIHVEMAEVKTKYEIEKRGRAFIFEPIKTSTTHAIQVEAIQLI